MTAIYKLLFILITEIIRIVITMRFTYSFFEQKRNKYITLLAYSFSVVVTTCAYQVFNIPWLNLFSTLLGLTTISLAYISSIKKKIHFVLYVLVVSCISDLLTYAFLSHTFDQENYSEPASLLSLFFLLMAQLFTNKVIGKNKEMEINDKFWWRYILSLIICIAASLIVFMDRTISTLSLSVVCGAFLLTNLIIVFLMDGLIYTAQKDRENIILKKQAELYEQELTAQADKSESLKAIRHDMKKHIAEIQVLAESENKKELREYINTFISELDEVTPLCDTGNIAIDGVMNYMLGKIISYGIKVSYRIIVPDSLTLSVYDMNIILGNLLENAMEASAKVENPKIDVFIKYANSSIVIEITNNCLDSNSHEIIKTTKFNSNEHGYGLKNIKKVLKKYVHTFEYQQKDGQFTVQVLMRINE